MTDENLEDITRYLRLEVPHYLNQDFKEVKFLGEFPYEVDFDDHTTGEVAHTYVYEVSLGSGEKVFAVKGGFYGHLLNDVYPIKFPSAELAGKYHLYSVAKNYGLLETEDAENIKELLELPEKYVKMLEK